MYKISDFSKKTKIPIQTLRYYDSIHLLNPAYTNDFTGYRYYTDDQISMVHLITYLKNIGLSLEKIKQYLITKDNHILQEQKVKLNEKIKQIDELLMKEGNNVYKIYEADYNKYIEINGLKSINTPQSIELRDHNSRYFVIEKDKEFFDEIYIYDKNNYLCVNNQIIFNDEIRKLVFNYLQDYYDTLTIYVGYDEENLYHKVKTIFPDVVDKEYIQKGNNNIEYKYHELTFHVGNPIHKYNDNVIDVCFHSYKFGPNFNPNNVYYFDGDFEMGNIQNIDIEIPIDPNQNIRIWTSHSELHGYLCFLYFCYKFTGKNISVIFTDEYDSSIYNLMSAVPAEVEKMLSYAHVLSQEELEQYKFEWKRIVKENSELRLLKDGKIISVNYDYLNDTIQKYDINDDIQNTIANLIEQDTTNHLSDVIYKFLIERFHAKQS